MNHGKGNQQQQHHQAAVVIGKCHKVSRYRSRLMRMPETKQDPRLSILVPTFNRYGRLYRGLVYLDGISSLPEHRELFRSTEIIIADGTHAATEGSHETVLRRKIQSIANKLNQKTSIKFSAQPGVGLLERFSWLSSRAKGGYVTMLGDEDMLVFDSLADWLDELDLRPDIAAISGQYVNLKGFQRFGSHLKILREEGLVNGVTIDADDIKDRLIQWLALGCSGIPSISYALMRREVFLSFGRCLNGFPGALTYCGAESLLNLLMLGAGKVAIKDMPYVIRDFTYLDHSSSIDSAWSDPVQDNKSWNQSLHCLNAEYRCFSNVAEMNDFGDWLRRFSGFGRQGRFAMLRTISSCQHILGEQLRVNLSDSSWRFATLAWRSTAEICYERRDLRAVGLHPFFFDSRIGRLIFSLLGSLLG